MNDFMEIAIKEAKKALKKNCVPIGCLITHQNKIIAKAHNKKFWHAEILCIDKSLKKIDHLSECILYTTIAPCPMCLYAIKLAKIKHVFCGNINEKQIQHKINIINIKNQQCKDLIQMFFKNKRTSNIFKKL